MSLYHYYVTFFIVVAAELVHCKTCLLEECEKIILLLCVIISFMLTYF